MAEQENNPQTTYIVVALFQDPDKGLLMAKAPRGKLQLPGRKMDRISDSTKGNQQITDEVIAITDILKKKTGYELFVQTTIKIYNFVSKNRMVKVFLMSLSDEYGDFLEESDFDFKLPRRSRMIFIPADPERIKNNKKILPDDKIIILDWLENKETIMRRNKQFQTVEVITVEAIA